jgi:hypothetical protein
LDLKHLFLKIFFDHLLQKARKNLKKNGRGLVLGLGLFLHLQIDQFTSMKKKAGMVGSLRPLQNLILHLWI